MDLRPGIKPESTIVTEVETGFQLTENMALTINGYDIVTKEPIVYYFNEDLNRDDYLNGNKSGTRGFEIEYKVKSKRGYLGFNYSFYTTAGKEIVTNYEVPFNHDVALGFAAHKVSLLGDLIISKKINIYSSIIFKGPRYGIASYDNETAQTTYKNFSPIYIVNVMFNTENLFIKNLSLATGVKNLFDVNDQIIQPYNNLHAPLPGRGREYVIKAMYNLPFK